MRKRGSVGGGIAAMNGNATNGIGTPIRHLQTLFTLGSLGAIDDARLLEIFVHWTGADAENAFTAIVRRHGPMVLGVCRRMLANPSDADDAFQATFLILARRASAIGRKESLASWLHGVAVRASREIRRSDARRRKREEQAMQTTRIESASAEGQDHSDLIPLLDEELSRLPERYRKALLACEIEGKSRRDAASQLGISEGTLSSRLARGRKLLRDRLAARGVSLGILPFADTWPGLPTIHLPESLAAATTRAVIGAGSGGTASTMVLTVADTILKTMFLARLKAGLGVAFAIGMGSILTATFAAGPNTTATQPAEEPSKLVEPQAKPRSTHDPRFVRARGVVVDEAGKPLPGIKVAPASYFGVTQSSGMTDESGRFDFDSRFAKLSAWILLATTADGSRQGFYQYPPDVKEVPEARIILKPSRKLVVRVADRDKQPVAGASVEIFSGRWSHRLIANATTDASGKAAVQLPADARIRLVTALKSGVGFDYDLFWREGDTHPWKEASDAVDLVLEGARTVTVKAVDSSGRPIPDVAIYPWIFRKDGKTVPEGPIAPDMQGQSASVNMSGSLAVRVKTDAQGIATFDWIPEMKASLQFNVSDHRYDSPYNRLPGELQDTSFWGRARRAFEDVRDGVSSWANGATLTMRLLRTEAIRGRVTRPDGRPAAGVEVAADGVEVERLRMGWRFRNSARTADDGTYEILAFSNQVYAVAVVDDNGAAPTRFGVIVREGEPAEGVDFQLRRGTFIHGTLTQGPDRKPMVGESIGLLETGEWPRGVPNPHAGNYHWMERRTSDADARGHYSIRLGPGTFKITGPYAGPEGSDTIIVTDENVLERDIHLP